MFTHGLLLVFCVLSANSAIVKNEKLFSCNDVYHLYDMSDNMNETIAHTIHSMTVQGLQMFNSRATENNQVPTVNHDISDESHLVLPYAPEDHMTEDFTTNTMNIIDSILSRIGKDDDGLGPNWSSTERIVHKFHMYDVWSRVLKTYNQIVGKNPPQNELCDCLLDSTENGIYDAVYWVAQHYKSGTPITLLNRPIPKLKDAKSWGVWKKRLLHYYTGQALRDASLYLYCATMHF